MPTYTFRNTETGEEFEEFLQISQLSNYKHSNPHLEQIVGTPNIIGGLTKESGSLPDGFKDKLKEMKKKHPLASGVDHLI